MNSRRALAALAWLAPAPAYAAADPARYMPAQLIAQTLVPSPGSTILVGFRMKPKPGWHGYWSNPGDSGIAPTVTWSAPPAVRFGPLLHPAPQLISADGVDSFVHEGSHVLLTRVTIGSSVRTSEPIPVVAELNWAACTVSQCVPLHATFRLDLVAGDATPSAEAGILRIAEQALPRDARPGQFMVAGKSITLRLPAGLTLTGRKVRFFPDDNDAFDVGQARAAEDGEQIVLASESRTAPAKTLTGVLTDGRRAYRLSFARADAPAQTTETDSKSQPALPETKPQARTKRKDTSVSEETTSQPKTRSLAILLPISLLVVGLAALLWWRARSR